MNKLVRSLLSGASLATLQLCAMGNAARATTIGGPRGAYTNPAGATTGSIVVTNGGDITGDLTNEGTVGPQPSIGIEVEGTISGSLINAKTGVINATEEGIVVGYPASIAGGIENAGKILVTNSATDGFLEGIAIRYNATSNAKITGAGSIEVNVQVVGSDTDSATARAFGVWENIDSSGVGPSALAGISNTGSISLIAAAGASSESAVVHAAAAFGLHQNVQNESSIKATLTNTGAISLAAAANAVATSSNGTAFASAKQVLQQSAGNQSNHAGDSISLTVTNSGSLSMGAIATAQGVTRAKADVFVAEAISQLATDASGIVETISNSGSLSLIAKAQAESTNTFAQVSAEASVAVVLKQYAAVTGNSAFPPGESIAQTITNSGDLTISLSALAKRTGHTTTAQNCCTEVSARASAERLFEQNASKADAITQSLTNSGVIKIGAKATASGVYKDTNADIFVERIFEQNAQLSNSATLSIANSAPIMIAETAVANGASPDALAEASELFYQNVRDGGAKASEQITNSGDISLVAVAKAVGGDFPGSHEASADARVQTAIKQRSHGSESVVQSLTNSGSLHFNLSANATGLHDVSATAEADGVKQTADYATAAHQTVTNSGTFAFTLNANAISPNANDEVEASAELGFAFRQSAEASGSAASAATANMTLTNSGTVSLAATAKAKGGTEARASAVADGLFMQYGEHMGTFSALVQNSGSISAVNLAQATGNTSAEARVDMGGVSQDAVSVTKAVLSVTNSGTMSLQGAAVASATSGASAKIFMRGVEQSANQFDSSLPPASATLSVSNSGTIRLAAAAKGNFGIEGRVVATAIGVEQEFGELDAIAALKNTGTIHVAAVATGLPGTPGAGVTSTSTRLPSVHADAAGLSVLAFGEEMLKQSAQNGSVTFSHAVDAPASVALAVSNSGTISVAATANGQAFDAVNISAVANGIAVVATSARVNTRSRIDFTSGSTQRSHHENGGGTVSGAISNNGSLLVSASAPGGIATANGIVVTADENDLAVTNGKGGFISVDAAGAVISAAGILENGFFRLGNSTNIRHVGGAYTDRFTDSELSIPASDVSGSITNNGTIKVSVSSAGDYIGDGESSGPGVAALGGAPPATITGIRADGIAVNAVNMSANILNTGAINVAAQGTGAIANGIRVFASQTGVQAVHVSSRFHVTSTTSLQTAKHSELNHLHTALGNNTITGKITNTGTLNVSVTGAEAAAKGIDIEADTLDGAVMNSGVIKVVANGTDAIAEGVVIQVNALGSGASFQNNGGTISATQNGKRGTAIDLSNAPSTMAVGLNGGSIYGNIVETEDGNTITVGSGNLLFDGVINPSKAKLGSLKVGTNGTLTLANNATEGNATAYVNSFVQNGTLAIVGGADGSSGSIHAANATISGGAVVNLDTTGAAYGASTTYKVVFSDADLSGTWSFVTPASGKTFFSASGVYSANEADITLTRARFDSISGLTPNEVAVAGAIETIYDTSALTGPLGKLFGALINLTPQQYADALESLSGIPAGELSAVDQAAAQSFLDSINSHLSGASGDGAGGMASLTSSSPVLASNIAPSNVTPAQVSSMSGTHMWGGGFQSGNSVDRTASGPAYTSHQSGLLAGIDVPVSQNVLLGVAASWSTGDIKTEKMLGFGTFSAGQFAGYGRFTTDSGLYGIGSVSYGDFTNKLNRFISIPGFGDGNAHGKFDSKVWGLYGEAGWHVAPSDWAIGLTPYAAISYLDAKSDGFTETGFGAPLIISGSSSSATSSYLGVKLENTWQMGGGTITPRLTAAWQHDFTKNAWEMSAAFAAVPTVGFNLNGSDLSRDGAYIDGGVTLGIADSVDVLLDYQGRFTSDRTDNAFMARANFKFW